MLQLLSAPYSQSFARNPLVFRFRATDSGGSIYRAYGVRSELQSDPATVIPFRETITLNWIEPDGTTGSETFTAEDSNGQNDIPNGDNYGNPASYYLDVVAKLNAHPVVSPLFQFYTTSSGSIRSLWAEARELDDDWAVSWVITGLTSPNFSVVDTTTVTAIATPDNYRLLWDLMLETTYLSDSYEKVAAGEAFIDANSEISIDLQEILNAEVRNSLADPPIPSYSNDSVLVADNLRRYYIRYREEYDGIVTPSWTYDSTRYVLNGGISQSLFAQGDWLDGRGASTSILSWRPDYRKVSSAQKEYLAWYNYTGETKNVAIEYQGTYADGTQTSSAFKYVTPNVSALAGETLLFPVGYEQLGESDTDIVSYSVRVIDKSSPYDGGSPVYLSPARTFQIDRHYREAERFLMYTNSFGCVETVRCTGYFTNDNNTERTTAERILSPGYTTTTRQLFQASRDWSNRFTYRTGFLRRLEVDSLQEMFVENEVFEVSDTAYTPIIITSTGMAVSETRRGLNSFTFEALRALSSINYESTPTPSPPIPPAPAETGRSAPGPYADHAAAFAAGVARNEPYTILASNAYGYPSPNDAGVVVQQDSGSTTSNSIPGPYADHAAAFAAGVARNELYTILTSNAYGHPSPNSMAVVAQVEFGTTTDNSIPGPYANQAAAVSAGLSTGRIYRITQNNTIGFPSRGGMGVLAVV